MGIGTEPAGHGRAGLDTPYVNVQRAKRPPVALRYEGATKDWPTDADGNYRSVTSTEQGMMLSVTVSQGQIKSSTQTGNTLHEIKYLGAKNLRSDVENRIRNSNPAKALVAAGKARIVKIDVAISNKKLVATTYFQALDKPNSPLLSGTWSN